MNRFSTDLHPSFLFPGSDVFISSWEEYRSPESSTNREPTQKDKELEAATKERDEEVKTEIEWSKKEEEDLQQDIIFSNIPNEIYSEVQGYYTDRGQLKRDSQRCQARMTAVDESGTMYTNVRNKKMSEWYKHLMAELKENWYANGVINGKRITEAEIKQMYLKECKKQFKDKIWSAGDKQFDQIKDTIFWSDSDKYPADKIYRDLTWAATIHEVNRVSMEWYDPDILDEGLWNNNQSVENMGDKQNRNFLKNDLTEYLRGIKKTSWIVKALQRLPIFNAKVDKPSEEDRKAIDNFLKVAEKITVSTGEDKAVALLKVLNDSELNTNTPESKYAEVLSKRGITVEKKYLDDLVRVGKFYLSTQVEWNSPKGQHAIYLSVLKIIEKEGGVSNAVRKFKPIVEQAKQDAKTEKKEWYSDGRKLDQVNPDFKTFASKLSITNFANATRLAMLDDNYFKNTPVEKVLANLNNDKMIDARDIWWEKSWQQFLAVFNQVWKETALNNLFARAKLENDMLGLGLDDVFKGAATQIDATTLLETFNGGQATDQPKDGASEQSWENGVPAVVDNLPTVSKLETEIKNWNRKLILLLQNIISKPGSDLISLMSRDVNKDPFEWLNLAEAKASADKAAAEMMSKIKVEQLRLAWFQTPESMQSGLANALYTEYTRWVGIWGKIPFDQWVKWLDLNAWFQYRNDGTVAIWLGINYKASANLWKWWYMNPELSAGAFIPLWYWKVDAQSIGGAWLNLETAKERVTKSWALQHIWLNTGARVSFTWAVVVSAWLNRSQDRVAWIDKAEQEMKNKFGSEIIGPILVWLDTRWIKKLDFSNVDVANSVKAMIRDYASKNGVKEEDMETVVDSTLRLLINYNNADISQPEIRDIISREVAERFALAWANGKKEDATKWAYLWWASLGAFWVVWAPYVWIYAGIQINKHNLDGYGDRWWQEYGLDHDYQGWWNEDLIKKFNQEAWFSEEQGLKVENGFVVVPKNLAIRVNVNEKLKWNMKKDQQWNILLHVQTPMAAKKRQWTATQSKEIIIWWRSWENFIKLDKAWQDWFTDGDINATNILQLGEGIRTYTPDLVKQAISALKEKSPKWDKIQQLEIGDDRMQAICEKSNEINTKEPPHKVKLVIDADASWNLTIMDPVEWDEWRWLDMEYNAKFEMIDTQAKAIAEKVYAEALKLSNPTYLWQVKHTTNWNKPWPEYKPFDDAMQSGNYTAARDAIKPIFTKLDQKYKWQSHFSDVLTELDKIENNVTLWQALMSIRNVFARAQSVKWGTDGQYHFGKESMSDIIARRAWSTKRWEQIKWTLKRSNIPEEYKSGYLALLKASEDYRIAHPELFNKKEAKAALLDNTIWFNLWDHTNPENPLFNPQIYDPMVDLNALEGFGFSADQRNALHKRAMENVANNTVLITPILKYLWLDEWTKPTIKEFKDWQLTLDVWGKQVILNAKLNFGYFTQCVNHTIILSDISATWPDGTSVQFNSGVWQTWSYREWNKSTITSTTSITIGVAAVTGRGGETQWSMPGNGKTGWKDPDYKPNLDF